MTLHGAHSKCIVGPSVKSAPWSAPKVEKCATFQAVMDPSANQIVVMQIHGCVTTWSLSNGIVLVIKIRRVYVKKPASSGGFLTVGPSFMTQETFPRPASKRTSPEDVESQRDFIST